MFPFVRLSFLCFFMAVCSLSIAKEIPTSERDSIGIQRVGDKMYIVHQVSAQETLFSISRKYAVPMGAIQSANESLKQGLKVDQKILIPFGDSASVSNGLPANEKVQENKSESTTSQGESLTATTESKSSSRHVVKSGETLFGIARTYGITVSELKSWNSLTADKVIVGQSLVVFTSTPTPISTTSSPSYSTSVSNVDLQSESGGRNRAENQENKENAVKQEVDNRQTSSPKPSPTSDGEWFTHAVKQGETLFSIANLYGSSVGDLIQWNSLNSNNLKAGQTLKVKKNGGAPSSISSAEEVNVISAEAQITNTSAPMVPTGFTNTKETGLAELIEGTSGHKKYLVLHRTAPIGSVIRVKNEENDLTIFARVVGILPDTGDNSKLLIKLSQAAFDQLKAVNARFPVEIAY
jgi:LysM repeat protein